MTLLPALLQHTLRTRAESALDARLREIDLAIRPEGHRVHQARSRARAIVDELDRGPAWMYQVHELLPHGSLHRGTGLVGFHDMDFIVVLDPDALRTRRGDERSAADTIERMASAIRARRAGMVKMGWMDARAQGHSVGVEYPGINLRLDLVPALREGRSLRIPRRRTGEWIETFPHHSRDRLARACAAAPHTKMAVRLLKAWRRARGAHVALPSYAIELIVVEMALRTQGSLVELVCGFFAQIAAQDARRRLELLGALADPPPLLVQDPDTGDNVTERLSAQDRRCLIAACRKAHHSLEEVLARLSIQPSAGVATLLKPLFGLR